MKKYLLPITMTLSIGLLNLSSATEASELPPRRPDTPALVPVRPTTNPVSPIPMPLPSGVLPKMPSPVLYYKDDQGRLVRITIPTGLYIRNDDGRLVPLEDLFEESDLETSSEEGEQFSLDDKE